MTSVDADKPLVNDLGDGSLLDSDYEDNGDDRRMNSQLNVSISTRVQRSNPFDRNFNICSSSAAEDCDLFADLIPSVALLEDHFGEPRSADLCRTSEELEEMISHCVTQIKDCKEEKVRRELCDQLISLRLRLHTLRHDDSIPNVGAEHNGASSEELTLGHRMQLRSGRCELLCERCQGYIWGRLRSYYQCMECHLVCHAGNCLSSMVRRCVAESGASIQLQSEQPYLSASLRRQRYICAECSRQLRIDTQDGSLKLIDSSSPSKLALSSASTSSSSSSSSTTSTTWAARLCYLSGRYYCSACHWNQRALLPAFVLRLANTEPQPVCRRSLQILALFRYRPCFDVYSPQSGRFALCAGIAVPGAAHNSSSAGKTSSLSRFGELHHMRLQIRASLEYLTSCTSAKRLRLLRLLTAVNRTYFVESDSMYSLADFEDCLLPDHSDSLNKISAILQQFKSHIINCELCKCRASVCAMCSHANNMLFSFDDNAEQCSLCKRLFHRQCLDDLCMSHSGSARFCADCSVQESQHLQHSL